MSLWFQDPPLSLLQANILAGFFASSYVGCLYLSQHTRLTYSSQPDTRDHGKRVRQRDDPDVIRARLVAVSLSTVSSCLVLLLIIWLMTPASSDKLSVAIMSTAKRLGVSGTLGLLPSLTAPILFLGPLYVLSLYGTLPLQRNWSIQREVVPLFATWQGVRNYIVAPITEEVAFRACVLSVYHMAGCSSKKLVFLSPLWFGLAHVHHGWEVYHKLGRTATAARTAVLSVVFQLAYTTLFGFHCAFLFLCTGSLIPPIASHIFCNIMGLPGFASDIAIFPRKRTSIVAAYLLGVGGYIYTLAYWTRGFESVYWPSVTVPSVY